MDHALLRIHLSDQLALIAALVAVGRRTRDENPQPEFQGPLDATVRECERDRAALLALMRALSIPRSRLKELAALAGERLGRLKLNGRLREYSPLSRLMELTGLQAGAVLRGALWTDLEAMAASLPALDGSVAAERREAAEADRRRLEPLRVRAAKLAFLG